MKDCRHVLRIELSTADGGNARAERIAGRKLPLVVEVAKCILPSAANGSYACELDVILGYIRDIWKCIFNFIFMEVFILEAHNFPKSLEIAATQQLAR